MCCTIRWEQKKNGKKMETEQLLTNENNHQRKSSDEAQNRKLRIILDEILVKGKKHTNNNQKIKEVEKVREHSDYSNQERQFLK